MSIGILIRVLINIENHAYPGNSGRCLRSPSLSLGVESPICKPLSSSHSWASCAIPAEDL